MTEEGANRDGTRSFPRSGSHAESFHSRFSFTNSEGLPAGIMTPGGYDEYVTPPVDKGNIPNPLNEHCLDDHASLAEKWRSAGTAVNGHPLGLMPAEQAMSAIASLVERRRQRSSQLRGDDDLWLATLLGNKEEVLQCLMDMKEHANVDFEVESCDDHALEYKGRKITAQCIHAAAKLGHKEVLGVLLRKRADPNAKSINGDENDGGTKRVALPIHLAAGTGGPDVVQMLLDWRADPNAPAKIGAKDHYFPIHDAAWFGRVDTLKVLIKAKAKHDAINFKGCTALHLAARLGMVPVVEYLLGKNNGQRETANFTDKEKQRLLKMKGFEGKGKHEHKGKTALDEAVVQGRLPAVKLHYLTDVLDPTSKAKAFMKVAKHNPTSVPYLLRNSCDSPDVMGGSELLEPIDNEWNKCFHSVAAAAQFTTHDLAQLISEAPQAFMDLLEILSDEPKVENTGHNPLPIRAKLPQNSEACPMSVEYRPEYEWSWHQGDGGFQSEPWHRTFAPLDPKRGKEVRIKVVKMKGLADLEIVYNLAVATDLRVFTKLSVHALLRYIWHRLQWIYFLDLAHELGALAVISLWASQKEWITNLGSQAQHTLWCIPASFAMVDLYMLVWGVISLIGTLRARHGISDEVKKLTRHRIWKKSWKNTRVTLSFLSLYPHRMLMSCLTMALVGVTGGGFETDSDTDILCSICVLLQWVFLLVRLRAFPSLGRKLLPIMRSAVQVSGMAFILLFLSLGFLHAYWSLQLDSGGSFIYEVTAFLFTGEPFYALGSLDEMVDSRRNYVVVLSIIALFIFPCCALNVFIAVLSDTYDSEQERVCCTFLQERARICLIMFLRPKIKFGMPSRGYSRHWLIWLAYGAGIAALSSLVFWGLLAVSADIHNENTGNGGRFAVWAPAVVMAAFFLLLEGALRASLTYKWEHLHLWFCHEASVDEISFLTAADRSSSQVHDGRLTRIRTEVERLRSDFKLRMGKLDRHIIMDASRKMGIVAKAVRPQHSEQEHRASEHGDLHGEGPPPLLGLERDHSQATHVSYASYQTGGSGATTHLACASDESEDDPPSRSSSKGLPPTSSSVRPNSTCNGYALSNSLKHGTYSSNGNGERRLSLSDQPHHHHHRPYFEESTMHQAARDISSKVDKVQRSLDSVHERLDRQEEQFKDLIKVCMETQDKLQDVLNSARSRKKDKDKRSNDNGMDPSPNRRVAPPPLETLPSPMDRKLSTVTFGAQEQRSHHSEEEQQQRHLEVPLLQLPLEKDIGGSREPSSPALEPLVSPLPPPAEPPPSNRRRFGEEGVVAQTRPVRPPSAEIIAFRHTGQDALLSPPQPLPPPEAPPSFTSNEEHPKEPPPPPPPIDLD